VLHVEFESSLLTHAGETFAAAAAAEENCSPTMTTGDPGLPASVAVATSGDSDSTVLGHRRCRVRRLSTEPHGHQTIVDSVSPVLWSQPQQSASPSVNEGATTASDSLRSLLLRQRDTASIVSASGNSPAVGSSTKRRHGGRTLDVDAGDRHITTKHRVSSEYIYDL
jgi:hypothetical protein